MSTNTRFAWVAMSGSPDNLVLDLLRAMRSDIGALRDDMRDVKHRLTSLEQQIVGLVATEASHYAGVAMRLDRTDDRFDRIERRPELADASHP